MNKEELKYIKENYFNSPSGLDMGLLFEMIDEVSKSLLKETETSVWDAQDISISLPTIKITEDWGRMSTKDREIIESFTSRIAPDGNLEQKLAALNKVISEKKPNASISEILSTMVICEVLSSILREFTESAGGFIFEGFLAGLFGGKSVQITSPEEIEGMAASGKPITDVVLANKHYSLKLLGQTTGVKGSFRNMIEHFKVVDHIIYLDARRVSKDQGLEFGEFLITLENFLDVFLQPFMKYQKKKRSVRSINGLRRMLEELEGKVFKIRSTGRLGSRSAFKPDEITEMDDDTLKQLRPFEVHYSEENFAKSTKAKWLFGTGRQLNDVQDAIASGDRDAIFAALEATAGYQKSRQFELTRNQAESIRGFKTVGTLMIGEQYMKETWAAYADLLKETIGPVYAHLQAFTRNVNNYFLGVTDDPSAGQNRKQFAMDAIRDAELLETSTNKAVKKIEGGPAGASPRVSGIDTQVGAGLPAGPGGFPAE